MVLKYCPTDSLLRARKNSNGVVEKLNFDQVIKINTKNKRQTPNR